MQLHYTDGQTIEPGDVVRIARDYRGVVVACIGAGCYLPGHEDWAYLGEGVMVDTDYAGLVHYAEDWEELALIERASL